MRKQLQELVLTVSALLQYFYIHSGLASWQWSFVNKNIEATPCQIPNTSSYLFGYIFKNRAILFALSFLFLASCKTDSKPALHFFTWSGMIDPEIIVEFEKKWDCRVFVDIYDSNESMYAKLKLGSAYYDVVMPSNYYLDILQKQGMIRKLDTMQVPNVQHLDPLYFKNEKEPLGAPFLVGFSGIAYRKDRIARLDPSWRVFSKKEYKGRMTMLNDTRDALGAALKTLGYSINTKEEKEIAQAANLLKSWRHNLAKFESEQYRNGLVSGEFLVAQAYSIDMLQVEQENPQVAFLYPEEGAILAIDYMVVLSKAPHPELAYAFINFLLEPEIAARNMMYANALIPVVPAYSLLSEASRKNPLLFPSKEQVEKMELIQDLGEAVQYYYNAWEEVKGG